MSTNLLIIVLSLPFTFMSCGQESPDDDGSSVVGKTFTVVEDDEEITVDFRENGVVFISGSDFGDGIEATYTYTPDDDDVFIKIGNEEILASYDEGVFELELEESEYYPEGYDITSVGVDAYEARVFVSSDGDTIQYRLFIPEDYDKDTKYPLVLFHHGGGGTGSDNIRNLEGPCPREWAGPERQAENPCFIVAPQTPDDEPEVETEESLLEETEKMWEHIQTIQEILDSLEDEFSIDANREYVTGLSMGGGATWMSLLISPERFAAAAPVCAGDGFIRKEKSELGRKFAQLPLWIFHGDADRVISVDVSREIVKSLKDAGGNPKYTEYKGVGHGSWTRAYREQEFIDWLFAQSR